MFDWCSPIGLAAFISSIGVVLSGIGILFWGIKLLCKKKE